MSKRLSITVDDEVADLVKAEQKAEHRNESQMGAVLIMEALAYRQLNRKAKSDA